MLAKGQVFGQHIQGIASRSPKRPLRRPYYRRICCDKMKAMFYGIKSQISIFNISTDICTLAYLYQVMYVEKNYT